MNVDLKGLTEEKDCSADSGSLICKSTLTQMLSLTDVVRKRRLSEEEQSSREGVQMWRMSDRGPGPVAVTEEKHTEEKVYSIQHWTAFF